MELTPQQWEALKKLFEEALEKAPAERATFLAAACDDAAVRLEVERLLAHHVDSGGLLSRPAYAGLAATSAAHFQDHSAETHAFSAGTLAADRFRVVRFLARGGMGEVYEAEDIELHERVALKCIRSEFLHDGKALDRFKREVHLARKVTHPNVCRTFDLFRQAGGTGDSLRSPVVLVAMELLEGQTLAEYLDQRLRLSTEEAAPIALQIASGLGAAHAAGILHRDFKPGNVLLVPGGKSMRAVITDFGLALRSTQGVTLGTSVTGTGEVLGTPAYMSPEQVENRELTPASDVYSLGLVLYQMVTGAQAFDDTTPLASAVRRVKEDPVPPRNLVPDLDRRWESIILKCLARDPRDRFRDGDEVVDALRGAATVRAPSRTNWAVILVLSALALVLVAAGVVFTRIHRSPPAANSSAPVSARTSVAVLPFHNLSGRTDTEWVATALPEMLTAELAAGGKLRTLPGENVARATSDLGLTGKQTLARDTLAQIRKYLGSDYVVLGAYLDQGMPEGQVRVDLWLQDTKTGETAATVSEKGSEDDLDSLATRVGTDLRRKLGAGDVQPSDVQLVRASLPSNPAAVRLYSEGLAKLRVVDSIRARDLLEQAVAADPSFALGHSALADAWAAMGYDDKARGESQKARELSAGLSREEQLWVEGRNDELNRQWDKAVEIYRTLFGFFPDNLEYGLHLANAQTHARTTDEALATLDALRKLPAPDRDDPRIDLQRADVFDVKGAYKEQQAAADTAAQRARELGAKLLLARALNREARALEKQGKLDDALASAKQAESISAAAGERAEGARALTLTGIVRFDQGNFTDAAAAYRQALAIQREIGDKRSAATTLNDLANALGEQGSLSESIKMLNEALTMFREVGDKHSAAAVLGSIAARTLQQGDLAQSKKMLEEGLAASREIGDQERTSTALYNLGEVLRWQGDLKAARTMYEQAEELSKQIGDQSGVAYALYSLGDVSAAEGHLDAARDKYNTALSMRNQMGEKGNAAETQMALAFLLIEEGHGSEAESSLQQAKDEFHKEGLGDDEILANGLLARISLSQGKVSDAQKRISAAHDLLGKSQDFSVRLRASIAEARVAAAAGKSEDSTRSLRETIARAEKSGYAGLELEAQLALGDVEAKAGRVKDGVVELTAVRQRARDQGFGLIAKDVEQSLAKYPQTK